MNKLDELAYQCGLWADGTPDAWDQEVLNKYGQQIVDECIAAIERATRTVGATTYDRDMALCVAAKTIAEIQNIFK